MFRFLARRAYKRMSAEELIRDVAQVRMTAVAAFRGVSGPSQLNKLAEQLVHEHGDWCRATQDPLGQALTLSAFADAVENETVALALNMPSADMGNVVIVSNAIWDLLEQRGLVDAAKVDEEMPPRLQERIKALNQSIESATKKIRSDIGSADPKS